MSRRRTPSEADASGRRSAARAARLSSVCAALIVSGCLQDAQPQSFGLTLVELEVTSEHLSQLRHGVYTETPVPCRAKLASVQSRCRLAVAGATTRDDLKKNFDLELDTPAAGRRRHRLSAMSGDPSGLRARLTLALFDRFGLVVPAAEPISLWLNGEFAGLYLLLEPIDADFFQSRGDSATALYKARDLLGNLERTADLEAAFAERVGSQHHQDLRELVLRLRVPKAERRAAIEQLVDTDSVLRYMAASAYVDNWDGIFNNYFLARTRSEPRFSTYPWDLDQTFGRVWSDPEHAAELFEGNALMRFLYQDAHPEFSSEFDRLHETAELAAGIEILDELAQESRDAYAHDPLLSQQPFDEQLRRLQQQLSERQAISGREH